MGRDLMTQFGFDVLVADGFDSYALKLSHDIIPVPTADDVIRFGSAFCLTKDGVSTLRVLVGCEEHLRVKASHAWRHLGLRPISITSTFGKNVFGKKVTDVVTDGQGATYRVISIFCPDVTRSTPYKAPEKITHFRRICA